MASSRVHAAVGLGLSVVLLIPVGGRAQSPVGGASVALLVDPDMGLRSGVENTIAVNRGFSLLVDRAVGRAWFEESSAARRGLGVLGRLGRYALLDVPGTYFTVVLNHEFIGHGGRYRELGIGGVDYGVDLPPPYGPGGGHASVRLEGGVTEHDVMAMEIGGLESQALIQRRIGERWMARDELDYADALLLWWSFQIQMNYVMGTDDSVDGYNDPRSYVRWLNASAGYGDEADWIWTMDDLQGVYALNVFNPFVAYAVFAQLEMLWNGGAARSVPALRFGSVSWLPALRTGLTPFGAEVHLENYLRVGRRFVLLDVARGDGTFYDGWGSLGVNVTNVLSRPAFALDADVRLWRQPRLLTLGRTTDPDVRDTGLAVAARGHVRVSEQRGLSLVAEVGYKSRGFLEGYRMDASPILLVGLGIRR